MRQAIETKYLGPKGQCPVKVIIKSDNYTDAAIAAATYNLIFRETSFTARERIGTVGPRTDRTDVAAQVHEWFNQSHAAPYPNGALLWWSDAT